MKLILAPQTLLCGECGFHVWFEAPSRWEMPEATHFTVKCTNDYGCSRKGKLLRFPIQRIEAEEIPPETVEAPK